MFKVIVERPRRGVRNAPRVKLRHDRLPDRAVLGMKRAAQEQVGWPKNLNENLAPLRRYLWKQRGRPWNRVFSEICATLDTGHTVKQHVREHLQDFIIMQVAIGRDGSWLGDHGWPLEDCWQKLYVDPRDGIVRETAAYRRKLGLPARRWSRRAKASDDDVVALSADEELRRIDGIWYRLQFDRRADAARELRVFDLLTRKRVWPGHRHAVSKRQLCGGELARHGLSNDDG